MNKYEEIVANTYKLIAKGDIAGFEAALAEDIEWTEAAGSPYAGTFIGRENIVPNVHAHLGADWADFKAIDQAYAVNEHQVFVYGVYSGINRVTDKPFEADFVHIYTLNDADEITEFKQITDTKVMWDAMDAE